MIRETQDKGIREAGILMMMTTSMLTGFGLSGALLLKIPVDNYITLLISALMIEGTASYFLFTLKETLMSMPLRRRSMMIMTLGFVLGCTWTALILLMDAFQGK